jgi:hypothetical protein
MIERKAIMSIPEAVQSSSDFFGPFSRDRSIFLFLAVITVSSDLSFISLPPTKKGSLKELSKNFWKEFFNSFLSTRNAQRKVVRESFDKNSSIFPLPQGILKEKS